MKGAKHSDDIFRVSFSIDYRNRGADPSKKVGKDEIPSLESQLKGKANAICFVGSSRPDVIYSYNCSISFLQPPRIR